MMKGGDGAGVIPHDDSTTTDSNHHGSSSATNHVDVTKRTKNRVGWHVIFALIFASGVVCFAFALLRSLSNSNKGGPISTVTPPPKEGQPVESPSSDPPPPNEEQPVESPSSDPPPQDHDISLQDMADALGISDFDMLPVTSPEYQALEWMATEDPLRNELLTSTTTTNEQNDRILTERYAVVVFYFASNGPSWYMQNNFLSGTSICDWGGIGCNGVGEVEKLQFPWDTGLDGTGIPSQLGLLTSLTLLFLEESWSAGTIPEEFSALTHLQTLSLEFCGLTGTIPEFLAGFSDLKRLVVRNNGMVGTIPAFLSSLSQLTYLDVGSNQLTGTIPEQLDALTKLEVLNVGHNELSGTIPEALAALTSLSFLSLATNELTGTVPLAFDSLTALTRVELETNLLTGNVDPIFCPRAPTFHTLWADCKEPNPEIICGCCTTCS